jgi:NDP-sugar pyrophosphorylase family protein
MSSEAPTIPFVVLAAGAGSRFGGEKPLATVGPSGESLLDYTVFDAGRVGFDPVVIVMSNRNRAEIQAHLTSRHDPGRLRWVVQESGSDVGRRTRPWGTVDAVLAARHLLPGPFAVGNADDFYGYGALRGLAEAMAESVVHGRQELDHLVTYPWQRTVPPSGSANRGVCNVDADGRLVSIEERRGLTATSTLHPDTQVSMNLWGFGCSALAALAPLLQRFVASHREDDDAELPIPEAMSHLVHGGRTVLALRTGEEWIGVTYPGDVHWAKQRIEEMLASGQYPARLEAPR